MVLIGNLFKKHIIQSNQPSEETQQSQSEDGRKKLTIPGGDLQTRMCNRIANTLKNTVVTRNNDDNESNNPTQPENVRIMFDVMTYVRKRCIWKIICFLSFFTS